MFCYQCEQTAKETGCSASGVCGKDPETAALQDLLIHCSKAISWVVRQNNQPQDREVGRFLLEALFTTITNVNFDPKSLSAMIDRAIEIYVAHGGTNDATGEGDGDAVTAKLAIPDDINARIDLGEKISPWSRVLKFGPDIAGLQELTMYGLKGMASYAHHAQILKVEDDAVYDFIEEALAFLASESTDIGELTTMALKVGEVNLRVMEMLDQANTGTYGHPEPTQIRVTPVKGKCIMVSGHDLKDLEELLKQTEGKGINVYTHGEMLPCLAYPELKKYKHLVGNYGGAWQDQRQEFDAFPGAILMTTNCIQKPKASYHDRIFTCGLVQWPDVTHISDRNFTPVIEAALAAPGFASDEEPAFAMTGFGHNAVMGVADTVIQAVKDGKIRRFFLIGGCDGAKTGRDYYTELAEAVPDDCVILTLACGKFRFNKLEFGDIGGIPRLLDMGQCNDAYSAIKVAGALAEAFDCGVNDLPLSMVLSWYEQKAVCILLTLLHLGIKDIRIGPSLPAFIGKNVLNVLVENYALKPITNAKDDLATMLAG